MSDVICDKCGKFFEANPIQETKTVDGEEIAKTYLECPFCKKVYPICYDNQATVRIKKQIRRLSYSLGTAVGKEYQNKIDSFRKKQNRLKHLNRMLELKYEKGEK